MEAIHSHVSKSIPVTLTGERLRLVRAVEVLERIGGQSACAIVQKLNEGPEGALATGQRKPPFEGGANSFSHGWCARPG